MGKNLLKNYPFRTDEIIIKKIDYIAENNTRNRNQQIEHLIKECILNYESEHGEMLVGEDGSIIIAKPTKLNTDKLSNSKTG